MKPIKPQKDPQSSALDALMGEAESPEESESPEMEAAEVAAPKKDPATIVASIQAELDQLAAMI